MIFCFFRLRKFMILRLRFCFVYFSLAFFSILQGVSTAQDEIEKIKLDPNKQIVKGEHRIPSPKTQKTNLTALGTTPKKEIEPIAINTTGSESETAPDTQIAAGNNDNSDSSAAKLNSVARRESLKNRIASKALTEIYRVGIGDVLDVRLLNSTAKDSTLYTVLEGGLLDYPLAGEAFAVDGFTTDEIAELLIEKIKLYDSPEVAVSVRDYASHKIVVGGMVEKTGEKIIRREAVPLFTVLAEAVQHPEAVKAIVTRSNKETIEVDLKELSSDVLVYHGDLIKIAGEIPAVKSQQFYFIAGAVSAPGQKEFHQGLTLTQAIFASGGTSKTKRATIFRQNKDGLLAQIEIDLKLIKNGKMPDVQLENGDRIEIK